MSFAPDDWRVDRYALSFGPVHISFQRFAVVSASIAQAPSSLGALPIAACATGELVLPVARDEGFWVGIMKDGADAVAYSVAARLQSDEWVDTITGMAGRNKMTTCARCLCTVPGIVCASSAYRPFTRDTFAQPAENTAALEIALAVGELPARAITIALVSYDDFARRSGTPPPSPLNPSAGYGGELLP